MCSRQGAGHAENEKIRINSMKKEKIIGISLRSPRLGENMNCYVKKLSTIFNVEDRRRGVNPV
jgi:hypothetical protein